jgi:hypothetical protein
MAQCKATKGDGAKCNNNSMHNSIYCYVHSLGRVKNVPLLKNSIFHFIVAVSLALSIFSYSIQKGPTREHQDTAISKTDENIRISTDIKKLLQTMQQMNKTSYDTLITKYPFGYILFAVDHSEIIVPGEGKFLTDYELNINDSRVIEMNSNAITLLFPDIYYVPRKLKTTKIAMRLPRTLNTVVEYPFDVFPNNIYFELLEDKVNTIIYVVGFK